MNYNGNSTTAETTTPPNRTGTASATRNPSNGPAPGKGPDLKAASKHHAIGKNAS
jgi:hypothetical protein